MTNSFQEIVPTSRRNAPNFVEIVRWRAANQETKGFNFLDNQEREIAHLSFTELDRRSRTIAAKLQSVVGKGERVLLLYPQGIDYISAFFGCLYAGIIAVPVYPPRNNRNLSRLTSIVENSMPRAALTNREYFGSIEKILGDYFKDSEIQIINTDDTSRFSPDEWQETAIKPEDTAFLQYTSGSTQAARGVIVTHENLIHNSVLLENAFGYDTTSHCVSWLPMYHDMGLIGGILQPVFGGYNCTLLSPVTFLQSPVKWLRTISRTRATISGAPNFAYQLCTGKINDEEKSGIDLSSWKVAFNGAEPIQPKTMKDFADRFADCGFGKKSFFPCYGLAEATLFVSGGALQSGVDEINLETGFFEKNIVKISAEPSEKTKSLAASGQIYETEQRIKIVDPQNKTLLGINQIGEIWIQGKSVAQGYWNNVSETEKVFKAYLADQKADNYLSTGDLGFINEGKLFVSGRIKELIIIRGVNHYPQDIEQTVINCHPALQPNSCAAFSVSGENEENLIIVLEIRRSKDINPENLFTDISRAVSEIHGLEAGEILLTKANAIPKTSSGKIQRLNCRKLYLGGEFPVIEKWKRDFSQNLFRTGEIFENESNRHIENSFEALLAKFAAQISDDGDKLQNVHLSGMDSLKVIELMHTIDKNLGVQVSFADIFESETLADLLDRIKSPKPSTEAVDNLPPAEASEDNLRALSYGQEGFWFLHQFYKNVSPDNVFIAAKIKGAINREILKKSLQAVINRHEILSSVFEGDSNNPRGKINLERELNFEVTDAQNLNEAELIDRISAEAHKPFVIEDCLYSFKLFSGGDREQIVLLNFHHSIIDFWSLKLIAAELANFYNSYTKNEIPKPSVPETGHANFVEWQKDFINGGDGDESFRFWKNKMDGELPLLALPTEKAEKEINSVDGNKSSFTLSRKLTAALKKISAENKTSLYTTLFAAYFSLLYRYTNQEEQIIGSPFSGRSLARWSETVGYLVNLVPLRLTIKPQDNFFAVQQKLKQEVAEALVHQNYPFHLLVEKLQKTRVANKSSIFQTMFVFQNKDSNSRSSLAEFALNEQGGRLNLGDAVLESVETKTKAAQFELSLHIAEAEENIKGKFVFNTALFDSAMIERLCVDWKILLEKIIENPFLPLNSIGLTDIREIRKLIGAAAEQNSPALSTIDALIESQVERTPDSVAVICGKRQLTYAELNNRAEKLAQHLQKKGVEAETPIGISLPRNADLIVSLLAILKSGGAYVPLDSNYPADRLSYIARDAKLKFLLTERDKIGEWAANIEQIVCVDEFWNEASATENSSARPRSDRANLAYIIYTSGSTGQPKGVAIEHRSAADFIEWSLRQFSPADFAGTLASTSINFDLSVFEIFVPLSCGGTVILVENALFLSEIADTENITLINTVPSAMTELVRSKSLPKNLATVNLAGEPLPEKLADALYRKYAVEKVFNLYGPSEDTTYSTVELLNRESSKITIGHPISHTEIYLLNQSLQPVPFGVTGEIYISGAGLARGYFNQPEMTAEKFLPNPFSDGGERMYKTGDVARYLSNGKLDFLGRIDNQVKIRGFRIELSEIEIILSEHPNIREAVVMSVEKENGTSQLTGFLVSESAEKTVSIREIRAHLREKLPDYMIPQNFLWMDFLPLTPNGKIDRQTLQKIRIGQEDSDSRGTLPVTSFENQIADIWREVVGINQAYLENNFFEIGGNSLQLTQVASRIKEKYRINFSLNEIFNRFTLEQQAKMVAELTENKSTELSNDEIKPISRSPRKTVLIS